MREGSIEPEREADHFLMREGSIEPEREADHFLMRASIVIITTAPVVAIAA